MNTFQPNCTVPPATAVFVTAPTVRSTFDIIWSCVSVLFLCSWSILHLNVPQQFTPQTRLQKWRLQAARLRKKIKWMLITLAVPEVIVAKALVSVFMARHHTPDLLKYAEEDNVPWTAAHTMFADMGGFTLRFPDAPPVQGPEDEYLNHKYQELSAGRSKFRAWLQKQSRCYGPTTWEPHGSHEQLIYLLLSTTQPNASTLFQFEGDTWTLTSAQLCQARNVGLIQKLPHLSESQLAEKGKSDVFVKVLAVFQAIWLVIQVVGRAVLNKPTSPLEIMTLAFAGCSVIVYVVLLDSPQDVNTPVEIPASRAGTADDMKLMDYFGPGYLWANLRGSSLHRVGRVGNDALPATWSAQPSSSDSSTWSTVKLSTLAIIAGSLVFGGLHLLAWNSPFPTDLERKLWRISSLITMLEPLIVPFGVFLTMAVLHRFKIEFKSSHKAVRAVLFFPLSF